LLRDLFRDLTEAARLLRCNAYQYKVHAFGSTDKAIDRSQVNRIKAFGAVRHHELVEEKQKQAAVEADPGVAAKPRQKGFVALHTKTDIYCNCSENDADTLIEEW
jgi:hypothetical protein